MENDYYYEPKIKTARNDDVQILNRCTFGNENKFKKELISFLEEKVKVCQEELDNFFMEDEENDFSLEFEIKKEILQEVLDFVNGSVKK